MAKKERVSAGKKMKPAQQTNDEQNIVAKMNEIFYGDCPNCGASLKGQSFEFIYTQAMKKQKLIQKYKTIRTARPDIKHYIRQHIDECKLNEKELETVRKQVESHLPLTNQSMLATIVDKNDTYQCLHCGGLLHIEFQGSKNTNEVKSE